MGSHFIFEAHPSTGDVVLSFEFLEAPNRRFYWRAVTADGQISQQSADTFMTLEDCAADAIRAWGPHSG